MPPVSKARLWDNAADRAQDVSAGSRSKRQSALQINLQICQWLALRTRHVDQPQGGERVPKGAHQGFIYSQWLAPRTRRMEAPRGASRVSKDAHQGIESGMTLNYQRTSYASG